MSNTNSLKEIFLVDNRIINRNIRDGRISKASYEQYIKSLPDLSSSFRDIGEEIYSLDSAVGSVKGEFVKDANDE